MGEVGSSPRPGNIFSIDLKEELNEMKNKNDNKNSSNSLVFGRWPQTKIESLSYELGQLETSVSTPAL